MVDKKEVLDGWPFETGDYVVGDPDNCVAIVTLGSSMNEQLVDYGCAIVGPLHTENLGIEKVVANLISNSNIRFLIICGSEVQGHITGKTVEALYENGIDPEKKSIIGSPGAIPFVENLEVEAVERFQDQISIVSMINNEDIGDITERLDECVENDPGAYNEDPMVVELTELDIEDETDELDFDSGSSSGVNINSAQLDLLEIETRIRLMQNEVNEIGSIQKTSSGYYSGKIEGIVIGFVLTLLLIIILVYVGM